VDGIEETQGGVSSESHFLSHSVEDVAPEVEEEEEKENGKS
jgi:hypothetical protein